jgi:hypothetical protein
MSRETSWRWIRPAVVEHESKGIGSVKNISSRKENTSMRSRTVTPSGKRNPMTTMAVAK